MTQPQAKPADSKGRPVSTARFMAVEFIDPKSQAYVTRLINVAKHSERESLMKLILWASYDNIELRLRTK